MHTVLQGVANGSTLMRIQDTVYLGSGNRSEHVPLDVVEAMFQDGYVDAVYCITDKGRAFAKRWPPVP